MLSKGQRSKSPKCTGQLPKNESFINGKKEYHEK